MRDEELAARAGSVREASPGSSIGSPRRPKRVVGSLAPELDTGGARVEATFDSLADRLEQRLERLAAAGLEGIRGCAPSWLSASDPIWSRLEEDLLGSLRAELASFRVGLLPGGLPRADAFLVDLAEEAGDLESLLPGHRLAQASLWGAWFELVAEATASRRAKRELLARGSRYFLRYGELVGRYLSDAYRRRVEQRSGQPCLSVGGPLAQSNPFAEIDPNFEAERFHLGAIVWGGPAEGVARELASRLDRVVHLRRRGGASWVCLSGREELCDRRRRALRAFVPEPTDARIAIGLEGFGEEGLQLSFRQAAQARSLACRESAVTHYADVAVEALALQLVDDARSFASHELRGIDDESAASQRLRETLAAYFAADLNAASAAASLGVHHQTVANRLRTIEDRLGRPLLARTLELALALRLRERMAP